MNEFYVNTQLRDGTKVLIRSIHSSDKEHLQDAFDQLSSRSRYQRFCSFKETLTEEEVQFYTDVDNINHVGICAEDIGVTPITGMGIGRYARLMEDPNGAEIACTVMDLYQGRGLGTLLIEHLIRLARKNGVKYFKANVMSENGAMIAVLEKFKAQLHESHSSELVYIIRLDEIVD